MSLFIFYVVRDNSFHFIHLILFFGYNNPILIKIYIEENAYNSPNFDSNNNNNSKCETMIKTKAMALSHETVSATNELPLTAIDFHSNPISPIVYEPLDISLVNIKNRPLMSPLATNERPLSCTCLLTEPSSPKVKFISTVTSPDDDETLSGDPIDPNQYQRTHSNSLYDCGNFPIYIYSRRSVSAPASVVSSPTKSSYFKSDSLEVDGDLLTDLELNEMNDKFVLSNSSDANNTMSTSIQSDLNNASLSQFNCNAFNNNIIVRSHSLQSHMSPSLPSSSPVTPSKTSSCYGSSETITSNTTTNTTSPLNTLNINKNNYDPNNPTIPILITSNPTNNTIAHSFMLKTPNPNSKNVKLKPNNPDSTSSANASSHPQNNNSSSSSTTSSSAVRRQRHSIAGQMNYFKLLGFSGFNKKMTTSANSLFSTAVISGSSSAPNLRDMIPNTIASPSGLYQFETLFLKINIVFLK